MKKAATILIAILFAAACSCGSKAPATSWSTKTDLLQLLIESRVSDATIPGIIMGVKTPDGTWVGAAGYADKDSHLPMAVDMQFKLASVTKTLTATIINKLVEQGYLSVTDTVEEWLPGLVTYGSQITVEELLNHTSGIHDHENDITFYTDVINDPAKEWTRTEILGWINSFPLDFTPGTSFSYSNAGYYLLGMIAESASDRTIDELASSIIFTPSGITRTSMNRQSTLTSPYTQSYSWLWTNEEVNNTTSWNLSWDWTAGCGVSIAADMIKFVDALFAGSIVNAVTLANMTTVRSPAVNYGYGIVVYDNYAVTGEKTYMHAGDNPGTATVWIYMPDSQRTIFIEFNRSDMNMVDESDVPVNATQIMGDLLPYIMDILNG